MKTYPAQLAQKIDISEAGEFIVSKDWVAEQKLDGHRLTLVGTGKSAKPYNRNGEVYAGKPVPKPLTSMPLPEGLILDGELLDLGTLEYWAFDLRAVDASIDKQPLAVRHDLLQQVLATMDLPVNLLPQAKTAKRKETLVRKAIEQGAEGVVFKKAAAPYRIGRGTAWRKLKFVSTVDCIVTAVNDNGHESAAVGVYSNGTLTDIGRCSLIGKPKVKVGDVVELRYLYATEDDRLYQPTLLRVRKDKKAKQCTIDQLNHTCRTVIAA